jgi:hypothetical protein
LHSLLGIEIPSVESSVAQLNQSSRRYAPCGDFL